ncbi:MAG: transporter ATP-binding protein [Xanthobacteraceae bacterium]|jgi:peptide/nickel transport system ATP-binding protein|nr:transporter ATP-binding protein [Xanthobacteraceae bacterium]
MNPPALAVRNLVVSKGTRRLVDGISLTLARGRTLGIIGESGSGKSLTALAVTGLLPEGLTVDPAGAIEIDGAALPSRDARALRALRGGKIAMVFQDPMACLNPFMSVGAQIDEVLAKCERARAVRGRRIEELLGEVGLPDPAALARRYPHELSGGQQQRVMLAMALAGQPDILIADEPTSALDASVQADIVALLAELQRRRQLAMLIITHDLAVAGALAHDLCVMHRGQIVEAGPAKTILESPQHPYTSRLVAARRTLDAAEPASGAHTLPPLVEVQDLAVDYAGRGLFAKSFRAVHDASFSLSPGRTLGLLGESGSGKSTVAAAVAGLRPLARGRIRLLGHELTPQSHAVPRTLRRRCQIVFQNPYGALNPRLSIARALAEPLALAGIAPREHAARIAAALQEVGLEPEHRERFPHQLSGGQRQRVCIARALLCEPEVLICDEVVSALDMTVQVQILQLLQKLQNERGFAMLFIGHDIDMVRWISDEVLVMRHGHVVDRCLARDLATTPARDAYTRHLLAARLTPLAA